MLAVECPLVTEKLMRDGEHVLSGNMARIKLLSTDFDGTLIGHPSDGRCVASFARALEEHKSHGGLWAVNTGRGLQHAIEGIVQFDGPFWPDFILTNEREVFHRSLEGEWVAHGEWNSVCVQKHADLYVQGKDVLLHIEKLASACDDANVIYEEGLIAGLITANEEAMDQVVGWIEEAARDLPEFSYQRNTIYLRFCHKAYHKGTALGELCRLENIPASAVMAAGDHYNDISMLDGVHAAMPACPMNAIDAVKAVVRKAGGFVSLKPHADGIAEAVAYFEGLSA